MIWSTCGIFFKILFIRVRRSESVFVQFIDSSSLIEEYSVITLMDNLCSKNSSSSSSTGRLSLAAKSYDKESKLLISDRCLKSLLSMTLNVYVFQPIGLSYCFPQHGWELNLPFLTCVLEEVIALRLWRLSSSWLGILPKSPHLQPKHFQVQLILQPLLLELLLLLWLKIPFQCRNYSRSCIAWE